MFSPSTPISKKSWHCSSMTPPPPQHQNYVQSCWRNFLQQRRADHPNVILPGCGQVRYRRQSGEKECIQMQPGPYD